MESDINPERREFMHDIQSFFPQQMDYGMERRIQVHFNAS